jgi:arginine repressor
MGCQLRRGHQLLDAHVKHRVAATAAGDDTIWLAVFF